MFSPFAWLNDGQEFHPDVLIGNPTRCGRVALALLGLLFVVLLHRESRAPEAAVVIEVIRNVIRDTKSIFSSQYIGGIYETKRNTSLSRKLLDVPVFFYLPKYR